jgi:hypothetical protein
MEEWFHAKKSKTEVRASDILIGKTLQLVKDVFLLVSNVGSNYH